MDEQLRGFITYQEIRYPFFYEKRAISLFPEEHGSNGQDAITVWTTGERGKLIENIELHGTTTNDKEVIFEVSDMPSDMMGFLEFKVNNIIEYDGSYLRKKTNVAEDPSTSLSKRYERCKSKIHGMRFVGGDINYFHPARNLFTINLYPGEEYSSEFNIRKVDEVQLGSTEWNGVKLTFSAYYRVAQNFTSTPLNCRSIVAVTFSNEASPSFIKDVYWAVLQTFRYLMRRNNIVFETTELFDLTEDNKQRSIGELNMLREDVKAEAHKDASRRGLTIEHIGDHFADLVFLFLESLIYIDNLPDSLETERIFKPDRMLFDYVAFEREYANLYPENIKRSDEFITAKKKTLEAIDFLTQSYTGKTKKYLKSFRKSIDHTENSLSERMRHVIKDCESILKPFLNYELEEQIVKEACKELGEEDPLDFIVDSLNKLRNDMAHGNLDIHLDGVHMLGFELLEMTIYAMRLKALGVDESTIQSGIARLMKINISLPDKT